MASPAMFADTCLFNEGSPLRATLVSDLEVNNHTMNHHLTNQPIIEITDSDIID